MDIEETGKYKGQRLGMFIFDCFMSALYLILSYTLLFTPFLKNWQMPDSFKTGIGILFGIYGIFRVSRVAKRIFQKKR
jgi:hypothetical protein